jgi:hypothetical protein
MGALSGAGQCNYYDPFPCSYHPDYLLQQAAMTLTDALPFASVETLEEETKEEEDEDKQVMLNE